MQKKPLPSLETLSETEEIGLEVFHPGGLHMRKKKQDLAGNAAAAATESKSF